MKENINILVEISSVYFVTTILIATVIAFQWFTLSVSINILGTKNKLFRF